MSDSQMLEQYQQFVRSVDLYPHGISTVPNNFENNTHVGGDSAIALHALGLCGEAGEIANKIKKIYRDSDGRWDDAFEESIKKELGDVLWYVTALCNDFGINFSEVITLNQKRLESRRDRGVLKGSGDNR